MDRSPPFGIASIAFVTILIMTSLSSELMPSTGRDHARTELNLNPYASRFALILPDGPKHINHVIHDGIHINQVKLMVGADPREILNSLDCMRSLNGRFFNCLQILPEHLTMRSRHSRPFLTETTSTSRPKRAKGLSVKSSWSTLSSTSKILIG